MNVEAESPGFNFSKFVLGLPSSSKQLKAKAKLKLLLAVLFFSSLVLSFFIFLVFYSNIPPFSIFSKEYLHRINQLEASYLAELASLEEQIYKELQRKKLRNFIRRRLTRAAASPEPQLKLNPLQLSNFIVLDSRQAPVYWYKKTKLAEAYGALSRGFSSPSASSLIFKYDFSQAEVRGVVLFVFSLPNLVEKVFERVEPAFEKERLERYKKFFLYKEGERPVRRESILHLVEQVQQEAALVFARYEPQSRRRLVGRKIKLSGISFAFFYPANRADLPWLSAILIFVLGLNLLILLVWYFNLRRKIALETRKIGEKQSLHQPVLVQEKAETEKKQTRSAKVVVDEEITQLLEELDREIDKNTVPQFLNPTSAAVPLSPASAANRPAQPIVSKKEITKRETASTPLAASNQPPPNPRGPEEKINIMNETTPPELASLSLSKANCSNYLRKLLKNKANRLKLAALFSLPQPTNALLLKTLKEILGVAPNFCFFFEKKQAFSALVGAYTTSNKTIPLLLPLSHVFYKAHLERGQAAFIEALSVAKEALPSALVVFLTRTCNPPIEKLLFIPFQVSEAKREFVILIGEPAT